MKIILLLLVAGTCYAQGSERWPIKTLNDGFAPGTPARATIHELHALKLGAKWSKSLPRQSVERNTFTVSGVITAFGRESDSDLHVVLSDGKETLVCEVPLPKFGNPKYAEQFQVVRDWLIKHCGKPGAIKPLKKSVPATVTGVFFVDRPHGFNKPTGDELHPVFGIR